MQTTSTLNVVQPLKIAIILFETSANRLYKSHLKLLFKNKINYITMALKFVLYID